MNDENMNVLMSELAVGMGIPQSLIFGSEQFSSITAQDKRLSRTQKRLFRWMKSRLRLRLNKFWRTVQWSEPRKFSWKRKKRIAVNK